LNSIKQNYKTTKGLGEKIVISSNDQIMIDNKQSKDDENG